MSEAKFTPGAWKWWTSNSWKRLISDLGGGESAPVLVPYVCPDRHPDIQISEADMKLIGAARDLYDALFTLAAEEWRDDDDPILKSARDKACAALAKATP